MAAFQEFNVPGRFPSLNEFYRYPPRQQGRVKAEADERVATFARLAGVRPVARARLRFTWVEPNRRRDLDNVAFGKKFVLDGLVKAGVLPNDDPHHVIGFSDAFAYDKNDPHVEVCIEEVSE